MKKIILMLSIALMGIGCQSIEIHDFDNEDFKHEFIYNIYNKLYKNKYKGGFLKFYNEVLIECYDNSCQWDRLTFKEKKTQYKQCIKGLMKVDKN